MQYLKIQKELDELRLLLNCWDLEDDSVYVRIDKGSEGERSTIFFDPDLPVKDLEILSDNPYQMNLWIKDYDGETTSYHISHEAELSLSYEHPEITVDITDKESSIRLRLIM